MAYGKNPHDERFQKLARRIEELRRKDETAHQRRMQIAAQRTQAVRQLWETCNTFVEHLNSYVEQDRLELSPAEPPDQISEDYQVQLLLNVRGRVLLMDIRAPTNLVATDNFKKPYILEGEVRFFNQELLEDDRVEEHGIFFCPGEGKGGAWMYWNGRTYKGGRVDQDYLAGLLEQIM